MTSVVRRSIHHALRRFRNDNTGLFSRLKSTKSSHMKSAFVQSGAAVTSMPHQTPARSVQDLKQQLAMDTSPSLDDFIIEAIGSRDDESAPKTRFEEPSYWSKIRKPVMEATTIPPETYRSDSYFQVEQRNLFENAWQVVGHTSQLKKHGDTIVAKAAGQPILVTRAKDGVIRGFYNACRHRGARLVSENGRYPVISCPYHRWGYALDGRLLATPMWKGDGVSEAEGFDFVEEDCPSPALQKAFSTDQVRNFNKKDYGLLPINVTTWG